MNTLAESGTVSYVHCTIYYNTRTSEETKKKHFDIRKGYFTHYCCKTKNHLLYFPNLCTTVG